MLMEQYLNRNHFVHVEKETKWIQKIKSYIVRKGATMTKLVEQLSKQYGWSASVPNLSGKLCRDSLRYREAVELADVLGYDIIWQRRKEVR